MVLSAKNGNTNAQHDLATVYADTSSKISKFFVKECIVISNKETIERDKIASYWYKKAADNGDGAATFKYAKRLESGTGVDKDPELAKDYYKKAFYEYGILDAEKKIKE